MSSLRNSIQRRNHRERGQPLERSKWGLLEKHKDYSLRAADHKRKKTALRNLKQKTLERNPDEFYFGMMSRKLDASFGAGKRATGMVNGDRRGGGEGEGEGGMGRIGNGNGKGMSVEVVRLLKTQDLGYVRLERNRARREWEVLYARWKGIKGEGGKVVWVDGEGELSAKAGEGKGVGEVVDGEDGDESLDEEEDDDDEDDDEEEEEGEEVMSKDQKRRNSMKKKESKKLAARVAMAKTRLDALTEAEVALEMQRAKMAKSPTVGGVNKNGVKFKVKERKR